MRYNDAKGKLFHLLRQAGMSKQEAEPLVAALFPTSPNGTVHQLKVRDDGSVYAEPV